MRRKGLVSEACLLVAFLGVIAFAYGWVYRDFAQDDAFITYRYARNIAAGQGFVYNKGEPVLGTTSPWYTLWLAALRRISNRDVRLIGHWTSVLSLWLGGIVLYGLAKLHSVLQAAAMAVVYITHPILGWSLGMETCLLNLFILLVMISYVRGKLVLSGALIGILLLIRYETVLLALILAIHHTIEEKKPPYWLAAGLPFFVAWLVYAWQTFGSIIPQSAFAKLVASRVPFFVGALVYSRLFINHNALYVVVIPLVAAGGYRVIRTWDWTGGFSLVLMWSGVYFAAASLVAGAFPWYYGPLVPVFAMLAVWGSDLLVDRLAPLLVRVKRLPYRKPAIRRALLIVFVITLTGLQVDSWGMTGTGRLGQRVDPRYTVYREAAEWLNRHAEQHETLAAPEIGVLGYYTELRIIDLYGLVTPALAPGPDEDIVATLQKAVRLYSPDYVISDKEGLLQYMDQSLLFRRVRGFGDGSYVLYEATGD